MFIEFLTYRYHGHSMSDPGVTYRTRDEIKHVRSFRDPINLVKHMILENNWSTEKELKEIEKEIKKTVEADAKKILDDPVPTFEDMYSNITISKPYIRGVTHDLTQHDYE